VIALHSRALHCFKRTLNASPIEYSFVYIIYFHVSWVWALERSCFRIDLYLKCEGFRTLWFGVTVSRGAPSILRLLDLYLFCIYM
jgi:hypothetical protein